MMSIQKIIPAILTDNPEDLRKKLGFLRGQSEWVHIDIMDETFVPRASVPIDALKEFSGQFLFEAHLMVADPVKYFGACAAAGVHRLVFHLEAADDPSNTLEAMGAYGFQRGIAMNPATPVSAIAPYLALADSVLLLGVEPGAQGNPFIPEVLQKAIALKGQTTIGVDGGVGKENILKVFTAGADYAVVGSAIWQSEHPVEIFRAMQNMVR